MLARKKLREPMEALSSSVMSQRSFFFVLLKGSLGYQVKWYPSGEKKYACLDMNLCNSKSTSVLEEHISSIFSVKEKAKKETASLGNQP
jgi:hypothetical protein